MVLRTALHVAAFVAGLLLGAVAAAQPPAPASASRAPAPAPPLFDQLLPNISGQRLRVDRLTLGDTSIPPHRHAGSVYLYVLEGAALLQIEGQPETVVAAGESFFEPAGARHTLAKSAEAGRPAIVLAVSIGPDGVSPATFGD